MNKFSPMKAALSGIDFIKNNQDFSKKFVLVFTIVYTLYYVALAQLGYFTNLEAMVAALQTGDFAEYAKQAQQNQTPQIMLAFLTFVAYIALSASAQRKMLRGEEIGFLGVTWGKDENRMVLSMLILGGMYVGFIILFMIIAIIFVIPFAMSQPDNPRFAMVGVAIALVAIIPFAAIFMVRFSQYGVMCIAKRKVGVMDSWRETKGHFWTFFGAHLIVYVAMMAIIGLAWLLAIKGFEGGVAPKNALEFLNPITIVPTILFSAILGVLTLCANSVGAYAFYIMHGGEGVLEMEPEKQGWPIAPSE